MSKNVYHPGGYISDRYGRPKPRVTLDVAIEDQITLADIRHLVDKAANFADDAKIVVFKDVLRVIQEPKKPVPLHHHTVDHLHFESGLEKIRKRDTQPRDAKGRFTKRKEKN